MASQGALANIKLERPLLATSQEQPTLCKRLLFGFWPCTTFITLVMMACIGLNIEGNSTGAMGFNSLSGLEAVRGRIDIPWLSLLFRLAAAVITTALPTVSVCSVKDDAYHSASWKVLSTFTIWTWIGMSLYFLPVSAVTAWYQLSGSSPSPACAAVLWVWFEVMYAMALFVFVAVWLLLVPVAYYSDQKVFAHMLSPMVLFAHNANVVIMQVELLLSDWTMKPLHFIFCIYFGVAYIIFNWWLYSKLGFWIYFFLDYDKAGVPGFLALVLSLAVFFWFGQFTAGFIK